MSWVIIDDGVPNHPKFLDAGPAAAWLWVCGLAYCRRHHTNGFIPRAALPTLGVPNVRPLVDRLVKVHLWESVSGGHQVHDYQVTYGDDAQTKAEKEERTRQKREAGRKGGKASAEKRALQADGQAPAQAETDQVLEAESNQTDEAHGNGMGWDRSGDREKGSGEKPEPTPFDRWFRELAADYPPARRVIGPLAEQAFLKVFERDQREPEVVFAELRAALANHKLGAQWQAGKVPRLDRWLLDGAYTQRHDPAPGTATASTDDLIMRRNRERYGSMRFGQ